jgi:long-chain fatty acid transport protein
MTRTMIARWATLLAGTLLVPATVHAGGFMVARFGGEHGNPMATNTTSIYYNPAGLAGIKGTQVYLEGLYALRSLSLDRPAGAIDHVPTGEDAAGYIAADSGKGQLTNLIISPFLGVATDFGVENLGVGIAFYTPFGGQAIFDKNDAFKGNTQYPGAYDGPQRWGDIEGTIRSSYISVGAGYKLPFGLSVGLSASAVLSVINDIRAFNPDGSDDLNNPGNGNVKEGRGWIDVSNVTLALGVGVLYSPPDLPELKIGLSYQSQPGFGKNTLKGQVKLKLGSAPEVVIPNGAVEQSLPDVIRLGVSYKATKELELNLWGQFERWSVFKSQCITNQDDSTQTCAIDDRGQTPVGATVVSNIPRNWNNSIAVHGSGFYQVNDELEVGGGLSFTQSAVPDSTLDVALPDFNELAINVAGSYALLDGKLKLTLGFTQFIFFSRTLDPQPRVGGERQAPYTSPTRQPDNAGTYKSSISLLTAGVGYSF